MAHDDFWLYDWDDPNDAWTGSDKLLHLTCSAVWWDVLARFTAMPVLWFLVSAVAIEVVEVVRYRRWVAKGKPMPWPWMTDKASAKDIVADVAGAVVGALL